MQATGVRQKALNIFHDKPFWTNALKQPDIMLQE